MDRDGAHRLSRRYLLQSAASTLGASALPSILTSAEAQVCAPITRRQLPVPNLTYSSANIIDTLAAVRPHRLGGVRLELLPAIGTGADRRFLIHNYGHGGGGITLSFGCASVVADRIEDVIKQLGDGNVRPSVAVIGTGIIGLTTAETVKRRFPNLQVTIYAKDVELAKTCSWVAGGQFEPSGIWRRHQFDKERAALTLYLRRSIERIHELRARGVAAQYGIAERSNYSLAGGVEGFDNPIVSPFIKGPKCGALPFRQLNVQGREYGTWLINPHILMPRLVRDLNDKKVYRRKLLIVHENAISVTRRFMAAVNEKIVINCTGLASNALASDPTVRPIKGQIVRIRNPDPARFNYFFSGSSCEGNPNYLFCRQNDIILGGTWDMVFNTPDAIDNTSEAIMRRLRHMFEGRIAGC